MACITTTVIIKIILDSIKDTSTKVYPAGSSFAYSSMLGYTWESSSNLFLVKIVILKKVKIKY